VYLPITIIFPECPRVTLVPKPMSIVVKNPIPNGTEYVKGSAICQGICTISYSTDGGRTLVKKEDSGVNFIEFYFKNIPAQKEFRMGFRAVVK